MSVILESAWQFVDLNATARKYCKLRNCIYRRFPSVSGSPCVCVYLYYCRLLENVHVDSMSGIKENAFLSLANVVFVGIYGCMYVYVIHV